MTHTLLRHGLVALAIGLLLSCGGGGAAGVGATQTAAGPNGAQTALNPANGKQVASIPFGGHANHFPTPSAADGLLLLPGTSQVFAFMGPAGLPPAPPAS